MICWLTNILSRQKSHILSHFETQCVQQKSNILVTLSKMSRHSLSSSSLFRCRQLATSGLVIFVVIFSVVTALADGNVLFGQASTLSLTTAQSGKPFLNISRSFNVLRINTMCIRDSDMLNLIWQFDFSASQILLSPTAQKKMLTLKVVKSESKIILMILLLARAKSLIHTWYVTHCFQDE